MAYTQKTNSGSLFVNDRKEKELHPDRTGTALIECPSCKAQFEAYLNGWLKESGKGVKFLSVSIKPKDSPKQAPPASRPAPAPAARPAPPKEQRFV